MVSKSEYQPWYGSEYITPREINEQWMDAYLRPESKIFCGTQFMIKSELVDLMTWWQLQSIIMKVIQYSS